MLITFAEVAATTETGCTLNGQPIDCAELANKAKPFIGVGIGFFLVMLVIGIAVFIFWLKMLMHNLKHERPDKAKWTVILIVSWLFGLSFLAALVYYFVEKKKLDLVATPAATPAAVPTSTPATPQPPVAPPVPPTEPPKV